MTRLYVGNIRYSADEAALRALFEPFGAVREVYIGIDRETGRSRGFAFVTMEEKAGADAAMTGLHGKEVDGRVIVVNEAQPRAARDGGGGGGRPYGGGGRPRGERAAEGGGPGGPPGGRSGGRSGDGGYDDPPGRPPKGGKPGRERSRDRDRDRFERDDGDW